ncbi:hypothetical protein BC835DRAFT_1355276 [Cytidiella melzeri]|nr:hypothetical protein BC835DRAFT_1355276 [Cytidiella melzeri]
MTSPSIKIIKEESELQIQFKLDDLDKYFSRSANPSRYTDHFGPGLRFGSYSFVDNNEPRQLGLYLYTSKEYPAMAIHFAVTARSLTGELFFTKSMSYTFKSGEAIGWSKFLNMETYETTPIMKDENALVLHATVKFSPLYPIVSKSTLSVLHHTIVGKEPTDIRYVVYSSRNKSGRLSHPRVLFGTKDALTQKCSTLEDILETGLPQLSGSLLGASERPRRTAYTLYRDDDSDFEDDDDMDSDEVDSRTSVERAAASSSRLPLLDRIGNETNAVKPEPNSPSSLPTATQADLPSYGGKTIVILGAAAHTWEAILYWLLTGAIVFAPLTSEGRTSRNTAIEQSRLANPDRPSPVSCKSVYRIADALKLESLKAQTLDHLGRRLSMNTYLDELFSDFTSRYEEVKKMEMLAVIKHWDQIKGSTALRTKMINIATGKLPHAGSVMADLLMKASVKDEEDATQPSRKRSLE